MDQDYVDLFRETRKQINLLQRQREHWKGLAEATQGVLNDTMLMFGSDKVISFPPEPQE